MTMPPQQPRTDGQPTTRYRAMSRAAVWSVLFGVASVVSLLHWVFLLVPVTGFVSAVVAKRRIREAPEELTGMGVARLGMWLSIVFFIGGGVWQVSAGAARVPAGYEEIDLQMLQPDPNVKGQAIPPKAFELHEKKVFVEGFIQPGRSPTRLKRFILCPRIADCNYCNPDPKPTEMIGVTLEGDLVTDFTIHPIHIGGTFEVDPNPIDGLPYRMKVDYLR